MRLSVHSWLLSAAKRLRPHPTQSEIELGRANRILTERAAELASRADEASGRREYMERISELVEARQMAGAGPWHVGPAALERTDAIITEAYRVASLREAGTPLSVGAYGDIDMALANVEWRREVNTSWLEFSRWGIQQIILISRLYRIKNPIIRRLIDVCAAYVFARGVEISSPDEDVNAIIQEYLETNHKTLGHRALMNHERSKDTDGNIFFVSFEDAADKGTSTLRTIDPTEIDDIKTDPDDTDTPWYYHRIANQKNFDVSTGHQVLTAINCWYPAYGYNPDLKPDEIGGKPVKWNQPVYHIKCGGIAKWLFGCPRSYPALDWSKESRRILEACASVKQSNAQIAREICTKGGQQAIEGIKAQITTTVGPDQQGIWDQNPPAVAGGTWVSGPGTSMKLVGQRGMSDNPEEVRRYMLMCCMVFGVPETFLGDVSTGNLATATSLDRPTETVMLEKQEEWVEDLKCMILHHLELSKNAPSGKFRAALIRRKLNPKEVIVRECAKSLSKDGSRMVYAKLHKKRNADGVFQLHEADRPVPKTEILIKVNFPAIREGDMKTLVDSTVQAMTLSNKAGQVIGIDEKAGVRKLYDLLDFENGDELTEEQYPESEYEIDRTKEPLPAPIEKPVAFPAGTIAADAQVGTDGVPNGQPAADVSQEAARIRVAVSRLNRSLDIMESKNGHAAHPHRG